MLNLKENKMIRSDPTKIWNALVNPTALPRWSTYTTKIIYPESPQTGSTRIIHTSHSRIYERILRWKEHRELTITRIPNPEKPKLLKKSSFFQESWELDSIDPITTRVIWSILYKESGTLGLVFEQTTTRQKLQKRISENLSNLKEYVESH